MMKNKAGFTLIEVLVALAIISIALSAIIKATSQNIKDTIYIQHKTIALWVANDIINEARLGLLKASDSSDKTQNMLGQDWPYEVTLEATPNPRIKQIQVDVFDPTKQSKLVHMESYLYAQ